MKPVTILKRARKLIERPGSWCKRHAAMTATYRPTYSKARSAKLFCAWGAINRAAGSHAETEAVSVFSAALPKQWREDFARWNDAPRRTHAQVLRAFDRAIALAEKEARQ